MRAVLGTFAKGCESRVPLYGCSAFLQLQGVGPWWCQVVLKVKEESESFKQLKNTYVQ